MIRLFRFTIARDFRAPVHSTLHVADHVRAGVLGLAKELVGPDRIPSALSGHNADGTPLRDGAPRHLFILPEDGDGDGRLDQLLLWLPDGVPADEATFAGAILRELRHVRCDRGTLMCVEPLRAISDCPWFGPSFRWASATPYLLSRFPKKLDGAAVSEDIGRQCDAMGLPAPELKLMCAAPSSWQTHRRLKDEGPRPDGHGSLVRLLFPEPVLGPIALGRHRHLGLGAFRPEDGHCPPDGPENGNEWGRVELRT